MGNSITHRVTRSGKQVLLLTLVALLILPATLAHGAETGITANPTTADTNRDGHIDRIVVTFATDPADLLATDFVVDGYSRAPGWSPTLVNHVVNVDLTPRAAFDTDEIPTLTFRSETAPATKDGAAPVLVQATGDDRGPRQDLFNDVGDTMKFLFSEPIALYLGTTKVPAQTPADKHLALEQALVLGGPSLNGRCKLDGDGVSRANFPAVSPTAGQTPSVDDPIDENWSTSNAGSAPTFVGTRTITVTQKINNSGSVPSTNTFQVMPNSPGPCTVAVSAANASNIREVTNDPSATVLSAINPSAGSIAFDHVRGTLVGSIATGDINKDGKIDQVTMSFSHDIDPSSLTSAALSRLTISDGATPATKTQATNLSFPTSAVSGSQLKVTFQPDPSWNTATKPTITYDDSGTCLANGLAVLTNPNGAGGYLSRQCAAGFLSQPTIDKAAPVALTAKTIDVNHNGQLDGVEVSFSEPVADSTFGQSAGFTVGDYTVANPGFATGTAANDNTVNILFSEVHLDSDKTPTILYGAPGVVADLAANPLATISIPLQSLDGAGPVLVGGTVFDLKDGNIVGHDGRIDETLFTFSEPVKDSSIVAGKFSIGGTPVTSVVTAPLNTDDVQGADDDKITLSVVGGVAGSDSADLTVLPNGITDLAGVASADAGNGAGITLLRNAVLDKAAPVVLSVTPDGQSTSARNVEVTFSEPMNTGSAPKVTWGDEPNFNDTIVGPDTSTGTNGWGTNAGGRVWNGISPAQSDSACSLSTGCTKTLKVADATGADTNALAPDTSFLWTVDVKAPNIPSVISPLQNSIAAKVTGSTGNVTVSGVASEANLTVQVFEAGTLVGTAVSDSQKAWSIGLNGLALGSHSITSKAIDAGGNESDLSAARVFSVKRITSVTLTRSSGLIVYGTALKLSGVVKDATNAVVASAPVTIQRQQYGTTIWRTLATVTANSVGAYSLTIKPAESNVFRAVYAGTTTLSDATSPSGSTRVRVALTAVPSATTIYLGQTFTIKGGVRPNLSGKTMRLQQYTSTGYKTIQYKILDGSSNYVFSVKPTARGTYKYKIYYVRQDASHEENYKFLTITVR